MQSDDLSWLLAVAQAGSLSAAAKLGGVAVSTVARRLAALEASLGLRLVDRRMNGSRLTLEGERIAMLAEPVVDGSARLVRAAAAMRAADSREAIRISATEFIVADVLAPALPRLWARRDSIGVVLQAQADVVSLAGRNADIAVRMSRPEGNSLIVKKLAEIELGLFASAGYLGDRAGSRLDLRAEKLLIYDDSYGILPEFDWISKMALEGAVAMRTGSTRALLTGAIAGSGIALLPVVFARREGLIAVDVKLDLPARTPWIVIHRDLRRHPMVRLVHAWIADAFKAMTR